MKRIGLVLIILAVLLPGCAPGDVTENIYTQDVFPSADSTFNLGSDALKWKEGYFHELYVDEDTLYIGGVPLSIEGINTIHSGEGAPAADWGQDGDYYIDTIATEIYGPKTDGAWGSPTALIGPAGEDGQDSVVPGPQGPAGQDSVVPGPQGPAGADSTVPGPQGPAGADFTIPGPQGPAGEDSVVPGPEGPAGQDSVVPGPQGPQGDPGPNSVTTSTTSSITGILAADGNNVILATNNTALSGTQESFTTALKTAYDWLVTNITSAWKTTVDNFISSKGQASGLASLDANSKVVQDPANAQTAAAQNKIPIGGVDGALATGWIPDLSGTYQTTTGKDATGGYAGLTLFKINFKNVANTFTSFFTNFNTGARTYTFQNRDGTIADDTDLGAKEATANKDASGGYAGLTLFKINFKNVANTITSWFTNTNTVARTYTFQDRNGTIADNTDIAAQIPDALMDAKGDIIVATANDTPAILTSSGVANNVLTVDTTTATGLKWAAPAGGNDPRLIVNALNTGEQFDVNASITMVKVTNLDVPLTAGTYVFQYYVIYRSDTLATGIRYSINYSGTNGAFVWNWYWIDLSATASTAVPDQEQLNAAGSVYGGFSSRAKSTTTRGTTLSVDTINADMFVIIEGVFVATGSGNLELWTASETTTGKTSTMIGTSVIVTKTK